MDELIKKALGLQMNGFIKEAIGIYEKALKKDPNNVLLAEYYGAVLAMSGQFSEAKVYLKKALRKSIEKPQVLNNLATVNRSLQLYDEALLNVKSALKFRPDYRDAWINRGNIHMDLRQWDEAVKCYQNTIKLDPNELEPYISLATSYLHSGSYDEALAVYKDLQRRTRDSRLLIGELICYRAMDDYEKALEFAESLKVTFNNEIMWFESAQTLWMAGQSKESLAEINSAIEKFGEYPEIMALKELIENA